MMINLNLQVLKETHTVTTDELRRRAQHALEVYDCALGERVMLEYGVAIVAPDLAQVPQANQLHSVSIEDSAEPAILLAEAQRAYASQKCMLRRLTLATPNEKLVLLLQQQGWLRQSLTIWSLTEPRELVARPDIHVVPGRSSYGSIHQLAAALYDCEQNKEVNDKIRRQFMDAAERHLDDPRIDSLMALNHDALPMGMANMVNVGETGVITSFVVHPQHRGQGVGIALMSHTLELAARSQYRQIALVCGRNDPGIERFYGKCGLTRIGVIESWLLP